MMASLLILLRQPVNKSITHTEPDARVILCHEELDVMRVHSPD